MFNRATTKSYFKMNSCSNKSPNWNIKIKVLDIMIQVAAGSNLKDKAAALYERLKKTTKRFNGWQVIATVLDTMKPLKKFENSVEQKSKNLHKYPKAVKLINKLSGSVQNASSGKRGTVNSRIKFLKNLFPEASRLTWSKVLDSQNFTSLPENPKKAN